MRLPDTPTFYNLVESSATARLVSVVGREGALLDPLAHMFVSDAGGALRTLLGDAHTHLIGTYPSWKTGLFQPFEGLGEQALVEESELRHDIVDYQTQAFRLRMMLGTSQVEWICDHLRQYANGVIEAIEVKQHPRQMDAAYVAKIIRAKDILGRIGWPVRILYEAEIEGSAQWQRNRKHILAHRSAHISDTQRDVVERLRKSSPRTTFRELRDAMDPSPLRGKAVVHALICAGQAVLDLQSPIRDESPVELRPVTRFVSGIRFA